MITNDISTCERLVMKIVWDSTEELALQEIMRKVNEENGKAWKPQTVSTFLARLVKKGFLTASRRGRHVFYQPAVGKEEFWKNTMQENAKYFTGGDMGMLVCQMCDDVLTEDDLQRLKRKIDELD